MKKKKVSITGGTNINLKDQKSPATMAKEISGLLYNYLHGYLVENKTKKPFWTYVARYLRKELK